MRSLRWSFILFQLLWLNAVLPGHTRGAVTMPGSTPAAAGAGDSCCSTSHDAKKQSPTPDQQKRCAVCYFAIGLHLPPAISFDQLQLGLISTLPIPPPAAFDSARTILPFHGRAPPAV